MVLLDEIYFLTEASVSELCRRSPFRHLLPFAACNLDKTNQITLNICEPNVALVDHIYLTGISKPIEEDGVLHYVVRRSS